MHATARCVLLTVIAGVSAGVSGCRPMAVGPPQHALRYAPQALVPGVPVRLPQRAWPPVETLPAPSERSSDGAEGRWTPLVPSRAWKYIVLHHTATTRGSVESIHRTHLKRKDANGNNWLGIGYHFVIGNGNGMGDGQIEPTFRWKEQLHGAHAGSAEYNEWGIGIALVGNFDETPPTEAQLAAVKRLVRVLKAEYGITSDYVVGHSDVKATACPGRYFPLAEIALGSADGGLAAHQKPDRVFSNVDTR